MKNYKFLSLLLLLCLALSSCKTALNVPLVQQKSQSFGKEKFEFIGFKNLPTKNKVLNDFGVELERAHIAVNRQDFYMGVYSFQELEVYKSTMRYVSFVDVEQISSTYNDGVSDNNGLAVGGWLVAGFTVFTLFPVYVPMICCADKNECELSVRLKCKLYVYDTVKKEIVLTTPIDYKWSEIYKGQYSHKDTDRDAINDSNQARMCNELLNQYARAYEYIATLE